MPVRTDLTPGVGFDAITVTAMGEGVTGTGGMVRAGTEHYAAYLAIAR